MFGVLANIRFHETLDFTKVAERPRAVAHSAWRRTPGWRRGAAPAGFHTITGRFKKFGTRGNSGRQTRVLRAPDTVVMARGYSLFTESFVPGFALIHKNTRFQSQPRLRQIRSPPAHAQSHAQHMAASRDHHEPISGALST